MIIESRWFFGRATYTFRPGLYSGTVIYSVDNGSVLDDVLRAAARRKPGAPWLPLPVPVPR